MINMTAKTLQLRFLAEEQIDTASRSKCDPPMNRQLPDEFNPDSHRAE